MLALNPIKTIFVSVVCALGIIFNIPNFLSKESLVKFPSFLCDKQITLGLDLKGGSSLLLEVGLNKALEEKYNLVSGQLNLELKKHGVESLVETDNHTDFKVVINMVPNNKDRASVILEKVRNHIDFFNKEYDITYSTHGDVEKVELRLKDQVRREFIANIFNQSIELIRKRVDETGTLEPNIQKHGENHIIVELPDISDPSRVRDLLGRTAKLEFKIVKAFGDRSSLKASMSSSILPYKAEGRVIGYYEVDNKKVVPGDTLSNSQISYDEHSNPNVAFMFNTVGSKLFGDLTKSNLGKQLAIIIDGVVVSAPKIHSAITGGYGSITGSFSLQEASDLSLLLRSGALPAPLRVVEQRLIGPDLGSDSVYKGSLSTILAIFSVALFMFLCYYWFGMFANIAVIFNLILLMATMTFFGVTLTLPGIAGIALTVGMAVDANVLIYERIKEEIAKGSKVYTSIEAGYDRAMPTIIDSNITTIIGGLLLYYFGSGPVRGFAVTLILGILISMFTAISLTKLIITLWLKVKKRVRIPIAGMLNFNKFSTYNIDFFKIKNTTLAITLFMTLGTVLGALLGRIEYGIDFRGGNLMEIKHTSPINVADLRISVAHSKVGEVIIQEIGSDRKSALLKFASPAPDGKNQTVDTANAQAVKEMQNFLNTNLPGVEYVKIDSVGPKVGNALLKDGVVAVILAMVAMLIYMWFRFEWQFGVAAIISLVHDCLAVVGYYVLTKAEFNITAIVAILITAGYSINDTVVIFDRIRDNLKNHNNRSMIEIVNDSINTTLSRTFLTSFTTLLALFNLYLFGGQIIADYSLPIIIGIGTGTYSSIFFAGIMLTYFKIDPRIFAKKFQEKV